MIVRHADRYVLDGPVTLDNVGVLIAEGDAFEGDKVIVDLAGVTRTDSSALSLLLEWTRRFGAGGRQIAFTNLSQDMQSLAALYGVADLIPLAAD